MTNKDHEIFRELGKCGFDILEYNKKEDFVEFVFGLCLVWVNLKRYDYRIFIDDDSEAGKINRYVYDNEITNDIARRCIDIFQTINGNIKDIKSIMEMIGIPERKKQ